MLLDAILMTDYRLGATLMHERHEYRRVAATISRLIMHTRLHYRAYAISARDVDGYRNSRTIRNESDIAEIKRDDESLRSAQTRRDLPRRLGLPFFLSLSRFA
jgi:hypothetical protein